MSSQFNILRKMFHFSGILIVIIYYFDMFESFPIKLFRENTRSILFYLLIFAYIVMVVVEILRFRIPAVQRYFLLLVGRIIKPEEAEKTHGSLPFFLGLSICIAVYSKEIAILSFLYLMIGDPAAAWFGGKYGKHKFKNGKSLEGLAAGIIGAFGAGLIFAILNLYLNHDELFAQKFLAHPLSILVMLLAGAITGFVFELFSTRGFFDDNFLIPVMSGLSMSVAWVILFNMDPGISFYSLNDLFFPLP